MTAALPITACAESIESALGDPFDAAGPLPADAVLAADEAGRLADGAEDLLDTARLNAAFVPAELGGTLRSVPQLIGALRPVFARDASLGLGYGVTTLMAGLNVWTAGDDAQQAALADTILDGGKVSVAYHELDHGNDFSANQMRAVETGGGYLLAGRKEVINNAQRARAAVVFARTDDRPGRAHSLFLVDLTDAAHSVSRLPQFTTTALRGVTLSGFDFDRHPVRAADLVGARGTGAEIALRSFQVSRTVMASAGIGPVDMALHIASAFAGQRVLRGRTVDSMQHARTNIALANALLLATDAMVGSVARRIHSHPEAVAAHSAAAKYLAPHLLEQAMEYLAVVLGARFYLRTGPSGLFGKHFRDIGPIGIGHAGGTSCLLTILPHLPRLTRDTETGSSAELLFTPTTSGTGIPFGRLRIGVPVGDPYLAGLPSALASLDDAGPGGGGSAATTARTLPAFLDAARGLAGTELGIDAGPRAMAVAARYCELLGIAAATGHHQVHPHPFTAAWARLAIAAIEARRTGLRPDVDIADVDTVFDELTHRTRTGRSHCLDAAPVLRSIPQEKQ
ncbi:acyl-CoA dehydrogenase family protein [Nocardia sp. IBHARD005]|uniref:acyl-CoA dehydrogenase family protein n=1 Tax=Nocardia sp. IBHARD005 TaxID=3457765 RepID=UPI004058BF65